MVKKLDAIEIYEIAESGNTVREELYPSPPCHGKEGCRKRSAMFVPYPFAEMPGGLLVRITWLRSHARYDF